MAQASCAEYCIQYIWALCSTCRNRALRLGYRKLSSSGSSQVLQIVFCSSRRDLTIVHPRYRASQMILSFPLSMSHADYPFTMSRTVSTSGTTWCAFSPGGNQSLSWYHPRREEASRLRFWTVECSKASRRENSSSMLHPYKSLVDIRNKGNTTTRRHVVVLYLLIWQTNQITFLTDLSGKFHVTSHMRWFCYIYMLTCVFVNLLR